MSFEKFLRLTTFLDNKYETETGVSFQKLASILHLEKQTYVSTNNYSYTSVQHYITVVITTS